MAKETDLLKDPVSLAQQRYQEQIASFKTQFLTDEKKALRQFANERGYRLNALRGKKWVLIKWMNE